MNLLSVLKNYEPYNEQEEKDREVMINFINKNDDSLTRENKIGHFTASSWILNKNRDKVLMIYHNIYKSWAWTGGHADGEENLLNVAIKEAEEETGLSEVKALMNNPLSLETITVDGHIKRGEYVPSHLHLNVTFLLEADDKQALIVKEDENSGVKWVSLEEAITLSNEPWMRDIYRKLNSKYYKLGL